VKLVPPLFRAFLTDVSPPVAAYLAFLIISLLLVLSLIWLTNSTFLSLSWLTLANHSLYFSSKSAISFLEEVLGTAPTSFSSSWTSMFLRMLSLLPFWVAEVSPIHVSTIQIPQWSRLTQGFIVWYFEFFGILLVLWQVHEKVLNKLIDFGLWMRQIYIEMLSSSFMITDDRY
jgi:hypothetical protein